MANFNIAQYHKVQHSKGRTNKQNWHIATDEIATEKLKTMIEEAKKKPNDLFIITLNDVIMFTQNL